MPDPDTGAAPLTADRVFRDYAPRVYNLARRMLGNDADAEDVTQDVLLQVVRKLDTFRGESAFPTWLHRVTVNAALAHRRKRATRQAHQTGEPLDAILDDGPGHAPGALRPWSVSPEQPVLDAETHEIIERAIARLPDSYRDVYVLADVEGLPNNEIGEMLGLSVPAVTEFRRKVRQAGSRYRVVKNSLALRAVKDTPLEGLSAKFENTTGVAYTGSDPVVLAKVLVDFAKEHPQLVVKAGVVSGSQMLDAEGVKALSSMPSLPEMRSRLLGLMQAPAARLVRLLNTPGGQLARVLKAHQEKEEGAAAQS